MKKRVVITGMGAVSPNGIGNQAFCRAVLDGVSGVKRIRSFDPSELPVQIAGEIQDFDELAWMEAQRSGNTFRAWCRWRWPRRPKRCAMPVSILRNYRWSSSARSAWCWARAAARRSSPRSRCGCGSPAT